jgi:HK97 family phage prohead protease
MRDQWETRAGGQVRSAPRGLTLRGYAVVFNQRSHDLGGFTEIVAPSAVDRTVREGVDLRALVNHNTERVLGRQSNKTLRVEVDAHGLLVEIDAPESEAGVVESVRRGDVDGMSFGFRPFGPHGYDVDRSTTPPTLTLRDAIIREVSVVTFPAYPQTELAVRALGMTGSRSVAELLKAQTKR